MYLLHTAAAPHSAQAKALAASSAVCAGLGVLAVGGWKLAGLQASRCAVHCSLWFTYVANLHHAAGSWRGFGAAVLCVWQGLPGW